MVERDFDKKKFEAVFDASTIRELASLEDAKNQNPLYVVVSYDERGFENWAGTNWGRKWDIYNLKSPGVGFTKGLWKSYKEITTPHAFSPDGPICKIIDPRGHQREVQLTSADNAISELFDRLDDLFQYDSWNQYDLVVENKTLKQKIIRLEAELQSLKE